MYHSVSLDKIHLMDPKSVMAYGVSRFVHYLLVSYVPFDLVSLKAGWSVGTFLGEWASDGS